VAAAHGLGLTVLPVTDDPVATRLVVPGEGELAFQDWFVARQHSVPVSAVRFEGVDTATPGPGVVAAIDDADLVVVAPSNPVVSIGPVLAVPGVADAVRRRGDDVVAISPLIGGKALKGPADRLLADLGVESSAVGVARWYAAEIGTLVIDETDAALAPAVESEGVRCIVAPTIMSDIDAAAALGLVVVGAGG
jgi:LPPG:FO 2-phospho-L-lactate transferase